MNRVEDGRGPACKLLTTAAPAFNEEAAAELDACQEAHFAGMEEEQPLRRVSTLMTTLSGLRSYLLLPRARRKEEGYEGGERVCRPAPQPLPSDVSDREDLKEDPFWTEG